MAKEIRIKRTRVFKAKSIKRLPAVFENACKFVEDGLTIAKALKKAGMDDATFYERATPKMKKEIYELSKVNTKHEKGEFSYLTNEFNEEDIDSADTNEPNT